MGKGDRIEARKAAGVEMTIMSNDGSMALIPMTTPPHSPRKICGQWELMGERVYSGGNIRLDMATEVAGKVVTTVEETITIKEATAMTVGMAMIVAIGITGVETAATVRSIRPAAMVRTIKGMIPQMIELWSYTTGDSRQTNSSVLRKDVEDRLEEAIVEVRTYEEDNEDKVRTASKKAESGISPGQQ